MIVIDASIIGPLILADEAPLVGTLAARLEAEPLIAPVHWPFEVANFLLMAERRGRLSRERRLAALREVEGWAIQLDADIVSAAWREVSDLAERLALTVYDAAYLELAHRRDATLATRDRALIRAAHACGVEVLSDLP